MDDMLVKSKFTKIHIDDLQEAFVALLEYQIKLNPTKYALRVTSRKFFDFMVSNRRIEANPEQIKAVQEMAPPRMIKDIQCLIERMLL